MEFSIKIQLKKTKSWVTLYFPWLSHIKLENTISAIEVGYSPLWTDFLWKVWKEVNLLLLFLPRDPYWWTRERNMELIPCTIFVNNTKRWVLFFRNHIFFPISRHLMSSNRYDELKGRYEDVQTEKVSWLINFSPLGHDMTL